MKVCVSMLMNMCSWEPEGTGACADALCVYACVCARASQATRTHKSDICSWKQAMLAGAAYIVEVDVIELASVALATVLASLQYWLQWK
jgi:hypothetical protein